MLRMEGGGWIVSRVALYNGLVTVACFGIDTLEEGSKLVGSTNKPSRKVRP